MPAINLPSPISADQLHPRGDIFHGRRLPEFKLSLRSQGTTHPIHIVGRYAMCEIHDHAQSRALAPLQQSQLVCAQFADEYHRSFETNLDQVPDQMPVLTRRPLAMEIRRRILATMADRIQEQVKLPLSMILLSESDLIDYWHNWCQSPDRFGEAHQHGCDYRDWTTLLAYDVPQMARPGFIYELHTTHVNAISNLDLFTTLGHRLIRELGGTIGTMLPIWDSVADQVNVYASSAPPENYVKGIPKTNDVNAIKSYNKLFVQLRHASRVPEPSQIPKEFRAYVERQLPYQVIPHYLAHGISPDVADRWASQGCADVKTMCKAQALHRSKPELGDGWVGWYARNPQLVPKLGFGNLPALSGEIDRPFYNLTSYMKRQVEDIASAIVPDHWWETADVATPPVDDVAAITI